MADYDETYTFTTQVGSTGWTWVGPDHTGLQNRGTASGWCWTSTGTASTNTGPPSGVPCVYTETSGASVPDEFTMTLETPVSAETYGLYTTFDTSPNGNIAAQLFIEAYDGSIWNEIDAWTFTGLGTAANISKGPYDFTSYTNSDFKIRFRSIVGGTTYQNDFTIDNVRIYGDTKEAPTACTISGIINISGVQSITI